MNQKFSPQNVPECSYPKASDLLNHGLYKLPPHLKPIEMTVQVYFNAGLILTIAGIYAWFWVKFKMKKKLFEPEPIEQALTD